MMVPPPPALCSHSDQMCVRSCGACILGLLAVLSITCESAFKMTGVIIESMSTKKLVLLGLLIFLFQVLSVLLGAVICK